jgi:hypothetical protein
MKKAIIICGFPGVGKTTVANNRRNILDAESSAFSWIFNPKETDARKRNPAFPHNYVAFLLENAGEYDYILSSSHSAVRDDLKAVGAPYIIVAPRRELKNEYLVRYLRRGSDIEFIELLNEKWDEFLTDIENDGAPVIWLDSYSGLADLLGGL